MVRYAAGQNSFEQLVQTQYRRLTELKAAYGGIRRALTKCAVAYDEQGVEAFAAAQRAEASAVARPKDTHSVDGIRDAGQRQRLESGDLRDSKEGREWRDSREVPPGASPWRHTVSAAAAASCWNITTAMQDTRDSRDTETLRREAGMVRLLERMEERNVKLEREAEANKAQTELLTETMRRLVTSTLSQESRYSDRDVPLKRSSKARITPHHVGGSPARVYDPRRSDPPRVDSYENLVASRSESRFYADGSWRDEPDDEERPNQTVSRVGRLMMKLINTGQAQMSCLHMTMARQYRQAVMECMKLELPIEPLEAWRPPQEQINANVDYLKSSNTKRKRINLSCYSLPNT